MLGSFIKGFIYLNVALIRWEFVLAFPKIKAHGRRDSYMAMMKLAVLRNRRDCLVVKNHDSWFKEICLNCHIEHTTSLKMT